MGRKLRNNFPSGWSKKLSKSPVDHTKKWVVLWLAAVSPCRAPIGRLSVCNISQLLRDSFSVSQQLPICEPPSHYSMVDTLSKQCKQCSSRGFARKINHIIIMCCRYISFISIYFRWYISFLIDTIPFFFIVLASKTKYKSNEVLVQSLLNCRTLLGITNCNLIHKSFELDGAIGTKRGLMWKVVKDAGSFGVTYLSKYPIFF